jgi:hypothetical protein
LRRVPNPTGRPDNGQRVNANDEYHSYNSKAILRYLMRSESAILFVPPFRAFASIQLADTES